MELRESLLEYLDEHVSYVAEKIGRFNGFFDLMSSSTDKANALDQLNISPKQAIILGNNLNGQVMLALASHSVVVKEFKPATPPHQRVTFDQLADTIRNLVSTR